MTREEFLAILDTYFNCLRQGGTEHCKYVLADAYFAIKSVPVWDLPENGSAGDFCAVLIPRIPRSVLPTFIKSNLLYRLLYLREPVRQVKCPTHQGSWHGISPDPCACGMTGWLP